MAHYEQTMRNMRAAYNDAYDDATIMPAVRATLYRRDNLLRTSLPGDAGHMSDDSSKATVRGAKRAGRERLDVLLVARGLAPSRERARAVIMAGEVRVDGRKVDKAGTTVPEGAAIELAGAGDELRFASRGGLKLERALNAFALDPAGCVCLDIGASTGGFTDVLLRRDAKRVYAIDVGHGQLAWTLRQDPRVVVMDRTNIRYVESLPEPADCAVIDVSFISLRLVLPPVARLLKPTGWIVALVKPQFEAGRAEVSRGGGVISDPAIHRRVLQDLLANVAETRDVTRHGVPEGSQKNDSAGLGLAESGLIPSPITGRDGNHEYLLWLRRVEAGERAATAIGEREIDAAVAEAFGMPPGAS